MSITIAKAAVLAISLTVLTTACSVPLGANNDEGKVVNANAEAADQPAPGLVEESAPTETQPPETTVVETPPQPEGSSEASFFYLDVSSNGQVVSGDEGIVEGEITSPSQKDQYTFQGRKGQKLVVQHTGGCDFAAPGELPYTLAFGSSEVDREFEIDKESGDCFDGREVSIPVDSTVTMTVSGDSTGTTGTYSFRVLFIEQPATIPLNIGTEVRVDSPSEGAGRLDSPAEQDTYSFPVEAGKTYAVRGLGGCTVSDGVSFQYRISEAATGSGSFKAFGTNCLDSESFTAKETGQAILTVRDIQYKSTGTYSFVIEEL